MKQHVNWQDKPEVIEMCLKCEKRECEGECFEIQNKIRELQGLPPLIREEKAPIEDNGERISGSLGRDRKLTLDGVTLTLEEWAQRQGMSFNALYQRLRRGLSIKRSLGMENAGKSKSTGVLRIEWRGEIDTITGWAKKTGINRGTIYIRLTQGLSADEIFKQPRQRRKREA